MSGVIQKSDKTIAGLSDISDYKELYNYSWFHPYYLVILSNLRYLPNDFFSGICKDLPKQLFFYFIHRMVQLAVEYWICFKK